MPVGNLIARLARRHLAGTGRAIARDVLLEVRRRQAAAPRELAPEPVVPAGGAAAAGAIFWFGLVALVLVILNVDLLLPRHAPRAWFRIALAAVLLPAGIVLAFDRSRVRPLLLARLPGHARRRRRGLAGGGSRLLAGAGLSMLGVVWIGAGVFDVLRGLRDLI